MSQSNSENPYEPPDTVNDGGFKLRPTRAMAVFIQLGLTWTPLLWTAVKASNYGGRAFVIQPTLPSALLCVLFTILIARRWHVRLPRLAIYFVAALFALDVLAFGEVLELTIFGNPDRTVLTFLLEPQTRRVCFAISLFSAPCTFWILMVPEPKT